MMLQTYSLHIRPEDDTCFNSDKVDTFIGGLFILLLFKLIWELLRFLLWARIFSLASSNSCLVLPLFTNKK